MQIIVCKMFEAEQMLLAAIGRTFELFPNTIKRVLNAQTFPFE